MKFKEYYLDEASEFKIYVDMDGVLSDFEKAIDGVDPKHKYKEVTNWPDKEFWAHVAKGGLPFWADMKWTKDGKQLWKYVKQFNPTILSAPARTIPDSKKGKMIWIKREVNNNPVILARAKDKQKYANDKSILIDDLKKNIDQWKSSGGIGILHKNTADTIKKLKEIMG